MRSISAVFRHVVLLTLTDDSTDEQRQAILDGLATLPAAIDSLRHYSFGLDAGVDDGNATIVAVGDFDDADGYAVYRDHPAHRRLIEDLILPVLARRTAIQYHDE